MGQQTVFFNELQSFSSKHIAKSKSGSPFHIVTCESSAKHKPTLLTCLLECDIIIYNLSENTTQQQVDDASWAIEALSAETTSFESKKMFILVSTVMTWAMTRPQDEDSEPVLTEEEYSRRRPHPRFKQHNMLEKLVLKLGRAKKSKLISYVVAAGLQYGHEQNLFNFFFKVSWLMQFPEVPMFGKGTNFLPTIHVDDLAGVIENLVDLKPKTKYILAIDESKSTLMEIVKKISDVLGPGIVNIFDDEDALAMKAFELEELEYLSINLCLEAFIVKDSFELLWVSEAGMVENMEKIVEEYKASRQLQAIRICLLGPPAVGKSTVAQKLCSHYQLHHITIKDAIEERRSQLEALLAASKTDRVTEDLSAARSQLDQIHGINAEDQPDDPPLIHLLQEKMNSKPCQNHGFVLDGFPETFNQAKLLFSEEAEDNAEPSKEPMYKKNITPEYVFVLNASDEFLTGRVQELEESEATESGLTLEEFLPRLMRYTQLSSAEDTAQDFFDHLEIHPEHIEVHMDDPDYAGVMKKITEIVGSPKNFGHGPEAQEEENRRRQEERRQRKATEEAERKQRNVTTLTEMMVQYDQWQQNSSEVTKQEHQLLEARALPLRNYLMKYVMPALSEAMLACSRVKPDDPVDFLSEHLLRNNQQD